MEYTNIITGQSMLGVEANKWTTEAELDFLGASDMASYYQEHKQGIEAAGFVIGSFIPGTLGIKALKLAQAGKLGGVMQRATNLFAGPRDALVREAKAAISNPENSLFGQLNAAKYKAMALGAGDNALQGLAFEMAVAGTMKASPLLEEQDMSDIASNMMFGALAGGVIGGGIEALFIRSTFREAQLAANKLIKPGELSSRVGYEDNSTFRGTSIIGDRVATLLKSVDDIPLADLPETGIKAARFTENSAVLESRRLMSELAGQGNDCLLYTSDAADE